MDSAAEKIEAPSISVVVLGALTWDAREPDGITFTQAVAHVAKLNAEAYAGFTDWRLPTRVELLTLVDDTKWNPAIDTSKFPDCQSDWYWTSTPAAFSPADCAWIVGFGFGGANWFSRDGRAFVRAVRPSQ
jgi:hypothetical protein